jgi:hypothetical protein
LDIVPKIVDRMAKSWRRNSDALVAYALEQMNLAQLYTAIDSPAGGKWAEPSDFDVN